MLTKPRAPMTKWSWREMSMVAALWRRRRVTRMSSELGVGSPEGWLWTTMKLGQFSLMAGRRISAIRTEAVSTVP